MPDRVTGAADGPPSPADPCTAGAVAASKRVRAALARCDPSRYPQPQSADLRALLARLSGWDAERIVVTAGATEVAHLVARSVGAGGLAFLVAPADAEWERAATLAGLITASSVADVDGDLTACCARVAQLKPAALFVASPNPLTGRQLTRGDVDALLDAVGDGVLVLDDSLGCFAAEPLDPLAWLVRGNFVLVRSLAPAFGLGGARVGYAVASPGLADAMRRQQPRWAVGTVAQQLAAAALADLAHYRDAWAAVRRRRDSLARSLVAAGFDVLPSAADGVAVVVDDAAALAARLRSAGHAAVDGSAAGLPRLLRLAVRGPRETAALASALAALATPNEPAAKSVRAVAAPPRPATSRLLPRLAAAGA